MIKKLEEEIKKNCKGNIYNEEINHKKDSCIKVSTGINIFEDS